MLTKEPFALLLPALLFIRLGLPILLGHQARWRDMPRLKLVVATYVGLGLLYAGAMAILIATAPPKSYGTQSLRDWSMFEDGLRMTLMQLPNQASWFIPVLLAMAACIWRCGPAALVRAFAFPFALTAIWIAPQILLYALRGGMWDHYWMPSILALAALNAWSLHLLRLKGPRFAYVLALIGLVVYLANGARTNAQAAANYVQRTLVRMEAVNALVKEVPRGGKVVIVADNKVFSEYAFSWIFFAGNAGLADATYLLYDVTQPYPTRFHKTVYFPLAPALEPAGSCDVDAIVFINPPATTDSAWARWYRSDCFHIRSFVRPQAYFSMRKLDFLNEPFTLEVAFRTQAR